MKWLNFLKNNLGPKLVASLSAVAYFGVAYAATGGGGNNSGLTTFSQLQGNVQTAGGEILKVVMTVITLAGIILVIKGLVHMKSHYTGTGQERHLSKGIASLGFGALLFIAVPLTHMLVTGFSGDNTNNIYNSWNTSGDGHAQCLGADCSPANN